MIYWFFRFIAFLVRALPLKVAYWLFLRICDTIYFLNPKGRSAVRQHLQTIFAHQDIQPSRCLLAQQSGRAQQFLPVRECAQHSRVSELASPLDPLHDTVGERSEHIGERLGFTREVEEPRSLRTEPLP